MSAPTTPSTYQCWKCGRSFDQPWRFTVNIRPHPPVTGISSVFWAGVCRDCVAKAVPGIETWDVWERGE